MKKVNVVIPLYNEEETLPTLIYRMNGVYKILKNDYDFGYIVVNDGSIDKTFEILKKEFSTVNYVKLLNHKKNMGFGNALKTGINEAVSTNSDLIVTIDGDTNYDHFLIPKLISELTDDVDIVTASPWHPEGGRKYFPKHRLILSLTLSWLYRKCTGDEYQKLFCYSAGFRVYRGHILKKIDFKGTDYLATAEILIKAILHRFKIKEFPIYVGPRWYGQSKMKIFKMIINHIKFLFDLKSEIKIIKKEKDYVIPT